MKAKVKIIGTEVQKKSQNELQFNIRNTTRNLTLEQAEPIGMTRHNVEAKGTIITDHSRVYIATFYGVGCGR